MRSSSEPDTAPARLGRISAGARWRDLLVPPAVAFLVSQAVLWVSAALAGESFWSVGSWVRWDGFQYIEIARHGYYTVGCPAIGYPKGATCGDAGWFPAYPLAIAVLHRAGLPLDVAAVLIAAVFQFLLLLVLWVCLRDSPKRSAHLALGLAAVFPSQVYLRAAFPMSMCVVMILLTASLLVRRRWLGGAAAGATAAAAYPTAVFLAPLLVAWTAWRHPRRLAGGIAVAVAIVCGFLAVLGVLRAQTGHWDTFLRVQHANYGNGLHNPVSAFARTIDPPRSQPCGLAATCKVLANDTGRYLGARAQAVYVAIVIAIAAAGLFRRGRYPELHALLTCYAVLFFVVPLATGGMGLSRYRGDALLVPLAVPLSHLRGRTLAVLVAGAGALAVAMSSQFLRNLLI